MDIEKTFEKILKKIKRTSLWTKIMVISLILIAIYYYNRENYSIEGFEQQKALVFKEQDEIYDDFYSSVYDKLKKNNSKLEYEISTIINNTSLDKNSKLLDIGSGTGSHIKAYKHRSIDAVGLDKSKYMIKLSKEKHPECDFMYGDGDNLNIFEPHNFSHITILNFTIYELKNKETVIRNCYEWLKPGGSLVLHLVNRNKFNPMLKMADPLNILHNDKSNKKEKKSNLIKFKNFDYKNIFTLEKGIGTFKETFKDKNNKTRINTLKLDLTSIKRIVNLVKKEGFIQDVVVDLYTINHPNEFLYFFYKPE